jgi:thiamine transport system substrate-binding protein
MKHSFVSTTVTIAAVGLLIASCTTDATPDEVVLLTHESFALSDGMFDRFTEETGFTVVVQTAGDAGSMVNQAILTKDNPLADVLYGIDNTFLSRAIDEGLFTAHTASEIATVPAELRVDDDIVTPIDFGDVCINYDIADLSTRGIAPPSDLADLTDDAYRDLLVVQDPATSSPGLAFLLATIAAYPEDAGYSWSEYWTDLFANGVSVAPDWSDAYSNQFTLAGGTRPLVVSYASSPPAEVFFGDLAEAPTAVMTDGCYRQVEYAGVLTGTERGEAAGLLVDFLLSREVQEDVPLTMFVFPANTTAALPDVFVAHTTLPPQPSSIDAQTIEANRERWIQEWTAIARSQ